LAAGRRDAGAKPVTLAFHREPNAFFQGHLLAEGPIFQMTGTMTQASTYPLTNAPMIADGVPASLVTRAQGNKIKPFPGDGDYSDAKSVSVTMGRTNVEKGLLTQSANSIAADHPLRRVGPRRQRSRRQRVHG
jgi:hypothetical protein